MVNGDTGLGVGFHWQGRVLGLGAYQPGHWLLEQPASRTETRRYR